MAKSKRKRAPKTVLKLPDLEQSKSAVMNSLTSASSKRSYDHAIREFIDWYCSEPRLAWHMKHRLRSPESRSDDLTVRGFPASGRPLGDRGFERKGRPYPDD